MIAWRALSAFVDLLKAVPPDIVASDHVGLRRPGEDQDLPCIAASVAGVEETLVGIGGLAGSRRLDEGEWEETTGKAASGVLSVEIWADAEDKVTQVADALTQVLEEAGNLVDNGFVGLRARSIGPMARAGLGTEGSLTALRLPLEWSFIYEDVRTERSGPGGIIRQIHVQIDEEFQESMELPAPTT